MKGLRRKSNRKTIRKRKRRRQQKGGAFGAALALGMFLPQVLGTLGKVLKINA